MVTIFAGVLAPADVDAGGGPEELQCGVGVPKLQRIGGLWVPGHAALRQDQVEHHAEVVGSAAGFSQRREQHGQSTNGPAAQEGDHVNPEIGHALVVGADLLDGGVDVAPQVAVIEPRGYPGVGQGSQGALPGQAEVL